MSLKFWNEIRIVLMLPRHCQGCSRAGLAHRRWLGNPTADQGIVSVKCWDESKSIMIVVADSCPCIVKDANGSITGTNPPCCGDIYRM